MASTGFFPEIIKKLINASQNHSISFNLWKDFLDTFPKNHQKTIKIWQKIMGEEDPLKQYDELRRKFYIILNLLSTEELEKKLIPIKSLENIEFNTYVTLKGMITKFLNLYIYDACKQCKKKLLHNNCLSCVYTGRSVKSLIITLVIDDGSEAIRVKFFGLLSQKILELSKSEKQQPN